ncbi:hypothetical protein [Caulobacter sp. DWR1-3-2b1]|uniref:hypothetical protein n=1 Tax=Caulobacter sp. DWR1-3-2b1 TaxID=2804670 RepID=UPI003CF95974
MSFDAAVLTEPQIAEDAFSEALASDPAASILKHAVKIWARDHGFAEDDVSSLTDRVVTFTYSALLDCKRKVQAVA